MALVSRVGRLTVDLGGRALDLALPPLCAGCRREGSPLCSECRTWVEVRVRAPPGAPIGLPAEIPEPLLQLEWCAPFTGITRRALHHLKYGGERRLAKPLGQIAAMRWRRAGAGGDVIVPVPASPDRIRERGYDQAVLLAEVVARELGLPLVRALARTHATAAQYGLGRTARAANVGSVFELAGSALAGEVAAGIRGRWVVLVDDIVTTGATLAGSAQVLLDHGATAVSAITIARER
jgi:ComF family protein